LVKKRREKNTLEWRKKRGDGKKRGISPADVGLHKPYFFQSAGKWKRERGKGRKLQRGKKKGRDEVRNRFSRD